MNWFECKVSYEKITENGVRKRVSESYLVDALSHAEAETRIIEEMKPYISGEFTVSSVRRCRYVEIFTSEHSAEWWKVKTSFMTLDERSGCEKQTNVAMLAGGDCIEDAIKTVYEGMTETMADYKIVEVKKSNLFDIFLYAKN
jgi:hypothetical protein